MAKKTNIKFAVPERYNADLASQGIEFKIDTVKGETVGVFHLIYFDRFTQRGRAQWKRMQLKYRKQAVSGVLSPDDIQLRIFCEVVLVGWSKIFDGEDNEVPFSVETAIEYFQLDETQWVLEELNRLASNEANFCEIDEAEEEEAEEPTPDPAGN